MRDKDYILISGLIFGIVAVVHGFRLVTQMTVQLGDWQIPIAASWLGLLIAASLFIWALILLRQR
ncbi:MAG: hypothetical protein HY253_00375 [Burkholderiales bacterium]|nr:hypothetical protein [Burkholderiales bacterium]